MHIKNVIDEAEIDEAATTKDFLVVQTEGNRTVNRKIKHFNLDVIIAVDYRKSTRGERVREIQGNTGQAFQERL